MPKNLKAATESYQNYQFQTFGYTSAPLFKENKMLKTDLIAYRNTLFVRSILRNENIPIFSDMFVPLDQNRYNMRTASNRLLDIPKIQTLWPKVNMIKSF